MHSYTRLHNRVQRVVIVHVRLHNRLPSSKPVPKPGATVYTPGPTTVVTEKSPLRAMSVSIERPVVTGFSHLEPVGNPVTTVIFFRWHPPYSAKK